MSSLSRILELVQRQELLGAGALVPLLYYGASRGTSNAAGRSSARARVAAGRT
ncbi:hypothetical protein [Amycolatopsis panacis]|uniref:hypothetical protein n=1 Tax=Amycolatopsis panacis TaxID=2340917 RepID=UPI001F164B33|nr:hypothetical protein [Amycolatopsis panacis]